MDINASAKELFLRFARRLERGRLRRFYLAYIYLSTVVAFSLLLYRAYSPLLARIPLLMIYPARNVLKSRLSGRREFLLGSSIAVAAAYALKDAIFVYRRDPRTVYIPEAVFLVTGSRGYPTILPTNLVADSTFLLAAFADPVIVGLTVYLLAFVAMRDFLSEAFGLERSLAAMAGLFYVNHVAVYFVRRLGYPDHLYALIVLAAIRFLYRREYPELLLTTNLLILGKQIRPAVILAIAAMYVKTPRVGRDLALIGLSIAAIRNRILAAVAIPIVYRFLAPERPRRELLFDRRLTILAAPAAFYLLLAVAIFGSPLGYRGFFSGYTFPVPRIDTKYIEFLKGYSDYFYALLKGVKAANRSVNRIGNPEIYIFHASTSVLIALFYGLYGLRGELDGFEAVLMKLSAFARLVRLLGSSPAPRQAFFVLVALSVVASKDYDRLALFLVGYSLIVRSRFLGEFSLVKSAAAYLYMNLDRIELAALFFASYKLPEIVPKRVPRKAFLAALILGAFVLPETFARAFPNDTYYAPYYIREAGPRIRENIPKGSAIITLYHYNLEAAAGLDYLYLDLYKADVRIYLKGLFESDPYAAKHELLRLRAYLLVRSADAIPFSRYDAESFGVLVFETSRMRRFAISPVVYDYGVSIIKLADFVRVNAIIYQNVTTGGLSYVKTYGGYRGIFKSSGTKATFVIRGLGKPRMVYAITPNGLLMPSSLEYRDELIRVSFDTTGVERIVVFYEDGTKYEYEPL